MVEEEGLHNETKKRIRKVEKVYVVKQSTKMYVVKQSPVGVAEALPATVSCLVKRGCFEHEGDLLSTSVFKVFHITS